MKEKLNAKVLFDEETWARFLSEVPKVNFPPRAALHPSYGMAHIVFPFADEVRDPLWSVRKIEN